MQKVIETLRASIRSCTRFQPMGCHATCYVSFFFFLFCILHRKIVHPQMTCSRENRPTYIPRTYNRNTPVPPSSSELLARFSFCLVKIDCSFRSASSLFHFTLFFFSVEASMHGLIVQRIRFNLLLVLSTRIVSEA